MDLTEIISGSQARINSQTRSAVVNVLDSDFPNGTIAFSKDSMYVFSSVFPCIVEGCFQKVKGQFTSELKNARSLQKF